MAYYRIINGQRYEAALLEAAQAFTENSGDGRISVKDAKKLLSLAADGRGITLIEQKTLGYIQENFTWTSAAKDWFVENLHAPPYPSYLLEEIIEDIKEDFDLKGLGILVDKEELQKQQTFEGSILFTTALREALRSFIEDGSDSSPRDIVQLVEDLSPAFFPSKQAHEAALQDRVLYYMNESGELSLIPDLEGPTWDKDSSLLPEKGESVEENWIFNLKLPALGDHTYWAVVDRKGLTESYNYGSK